ncbi:MAG: DUF2203 domain-containing protein [Terriglobia bacterium]|nr:MAG: DUF2203 domain-containing protein [Terriglobia bacterium]
MPKRFTLPEAQSLIPSVDSLLRNALEAKSCHDEAESILEAFTQRILLMGGVLIDRNQVKKARSLRERAAKDVQKIVDRVQEYGCVVKDLDAGLIDFPTLFRGREVYLCWKLGEPSIDWWHGTDEGFAGRKAIDQEFRDHHRGDFTQ